LFVDVYTCVRRCVVVGEPKYSIKNVEKIYLESARKGDVGKGADSVVAYEVDER
jgi:uncharacterized protein